MVSDCRAVERLSRKCSGPWLAAILSQSIDFDSIDVGFRYHSISNSQYFFDIAYDIARSFRFPVRNFEDINYFLCSFSKSQNRHCGLISIEARDRVLRDVDKNEKEVRMIPTGSSRQHFCSWRWVRSECL